jgi:hypothetical protein
MNFKTTKLRKSKIGASSSELIEFAVDTALSWEGNFPPIGPGDYLVHIESDDGNQHTVLVSRRYTRAIDSENAVDIAMDAFLERNINEGWENAKAIEAVEITK